jgi:REP element-mobilizing transposase RayT
VPGGIYHVTNKGCINSDIFLDNTDRRCFETILSAVVARQGWTCSMFCLMTTHYHLLVMTPQPDLAYGMQRLNGQYGHTFNWRHGGKGHVFMARYGAEFIQTEAHLLDVIRYIAMNPVKAKICGRPEDWRWSTYAETLGRRSPRPFVDPTLVLKAFAEDLELARSRLQAFVEDEAYAAQFLNRV